MLRPYVRERPIFCLLADLDLLLIVSIMTFFHSLAHFGTYATSDVHWRGVLIQGVPSQSKEIPFAWHVTKVNMPKPESWPVLQCDPGAV